MPASVRLPSARPVRAEVAAQLAACPADSAAGGAPECACVPSQTESGLSVLLGQNLTLPQTSSHQERAGEC